MPRFWQEFLASVQRAFLPAAANVQVLNALNREVVATFDVGQQARSVEFSRLSHTNVAVAQPVFTILAQADDSIAVYHNLVF